MKVNIGSYVHYWSTRDLEDWWFKFRYDKFPWNFGVKEEERDWLDKLVVKLLDLWDKTVCRFVNRVIKDRINRKVKVKIHPYDVWSMDHTLSLIVLPMLKQLNINKHGAPYTDDDDVPEHLRSTSAPAKENEWDTDDNHFLRWDWVIGEMIWTFEQLSSDDDESQFYHHEFGKDDVVPEGYVWINGIRKVMKGFWIDRIGQDIHSKRIENGLRLFGKYYRGLWD